MADEVERYKKLDKEIQDLKGEKIRFEERFNNKKQRLEQLINEITEKGYDPKNLSSIRDEKKEKLNKILEKLEKDTKEISEKLNNIEV